VISLLAYLSIHQLWYIMFLGFIMLTRTFVFKLRAYIGQKMRKRHRDRQDDGQINRLISLSAWHQMCHHVCHFNIHTNSLHCCCKYRISTL